MHPTNSQPTLRHTLAGFRLAHSLGVGARACSDYFTVGGLRCRLEVFPGGCTPEHQGHVSVFITSPDAYASGQLFLHEVSVVDATTGKAHVTAGRGQTSGPRPADAWGVVASHPRLCKTDDAFARLHHDSLTIRVTVQALRSWSHGVSTHMPYAYNPAFPPPHLLYAAAPPPPVVAPGAGLPPIYMG